MAFAGMNHLAVFVAAFYEMVHDIKETVRCCEMERRVALVVEVGILEERGVGTNDALDNKQVVGENRSSKPAVGFDHVDIVCMAVGSTDVVMRALGAPC